MRHIIHNYKLRLTNLSQGNRSLKLARLSRRRDMDLKELGFLNDIPVEDILQKIIAGKDVRLINRLDPRHESTNQADRRLNNIYRSVQHIFEETGTYDLFVGYPFVEGKFIDETIVRCPVLLFPVRLERNLQSRPRWNLKIIQEEPVVFNKTFFLAYEQFQQVRLAPDFWEEEIESGNDWLQWINDLYQKIKSYEIEVNFNSDLFQLKVDRFSDYLMEKMNGFRTGNLIFRSNAVLGIFPQSDSALLQDYQHIEQRLDEFEVDKFFSSGLAATEKEDQEKPKTYIKEEDRFFVTEVDQSQETALLKIKERESLVIHGPPGTGKSQVIVNIIADAMAHGKKVLLVSQKRAALDVVHKRLQSLGLGRFSVLVHDYRHDRAAIYRQIKRQIEDIDVFKKEIRDLNITKWDHDYKRISRQADQLTRQFEELNDGLSKQQSFGMSMHELYLTQQPEIPLLPLKEIAGKMDVAKLEVFTEKLAAVLDYTDFYHEDYPWKNRISFRHYEYEDRQRISKQLQEIPSGLTALHEAHESLSKKINESILDPKKNQIYLETYRQVNAILNTPQMREDIEAIYLDELTPDFIKKKFGQMGKILDEMEELVLLKTFPWRLFSELKKHLANFEKLQEKFTRWVSIDYLRARWFLKKLLEPHQLKLDEESLPKLKKEFKLFTRLHWHYVRIHDRRFFEDFPLMDSLSEKQQWIIRKENHLKAFQAVHTHKYFRRFKPRFSYGKLSDEDWQASMRMIDQLTRFNRKLQDAQRKWGIFLHPKQVEKLTARIVQNRGDNEFSIPLIQTFEQDFAEIKGLDGLLANFTPTENQALEFLIPEISPETQELEFLNRVKNSVYFYWIEQTERVNPLLSEVSTRSWPRKQREYIQHLSNRRVKVSELILRRIMESIVENIEYNRLKNPVTYRTIQHQVSKKRRLWSVRKLIHETWHSGLNRLAPCWMASPESVAAIFPMEKDFFDVVIFDEASQCFVERAIPIILRGKQSVIAGDEKQLQPLDLYKVRYDDTEAAFAEEEIALEVESILDLAKTTFQESQLSWHYRSQEEALINFSNYAFYEGKLQVIPPAVHRATYHPPLEWIDIKGNWRSNRNIPEAKQIISLVKKLIVRENPPSIGIVTFNYHQQELIKDLLDEELESLAKENETMFESLQAAMHKTEAEEFKGLFVKNIENVQGDERDIIIFSVGYGHNEKGKLITNFGLLNQQGGENRLNVAITRAREKIYVVCSFNPNELDVSKALHEGPKYFKDYLVYAKAISEQRTSEALHLLNRQQAADVFQTAPNPIADYIGAALEEKGFAVVQNFGDTSYKLDIAIKRNTDDPDFLLGIECEGPNYFSGISPKEREIYRRNLLESRNWKIHRVWARNFWMNREKEVEKILKLLK